MRPATSLRIVAGIGAAWALTVFVMYVRGDPEAGSTLAQLLVLALIVAGLAWVVYRFRIEPRRGSFDAQARRAGLRAQPGDPLDLMQAGFELFQRPASARDLKNTAWGGDSSGRGIVIADYWYAPSSNPSLDDYRRFVCVGEARPAWADLSVTPIERRFRGEGRSGCRTGSQRGEDLVPGSAGPSAHPPLPGRPRWRCA